jgi:hypothetical protein
MTLLPPIRPLAYQPVVVAILVALALVIVLGLTIDRAALRAWGK